MVQGYGSLGCNLAFGVELQTVCEDEKLHDFKGKSPLACALLWDNAKAVEILLRSGADPDFRDSEERTAFAVWLKKKAWQRKEGRMSVSSSMPDAMWMASGKSCR